MDHINPPTQGNDLVSGPSLKDRLPKLPLFVWLILLFFSAVLLAAGIYIAVSPDISLKSLFTRLMRGPQEVEEQQNIWSAYTPTPPPIMGGKQLYRISGGDINFPLITEVTIDPQDAKKDQDQSVTVKANGPTAIKEVVIVLRLDDENNFEYKLAQSSGTPTNGEWKGNWKFPHTYNKTYRLNIKARNENNLGNMATITIR